MRKVILNKNKLIYLVDDEIAICETISHELQSYGYKVNYFHTGSEAIQGIQKEKPDVCIVDLGLPDMDGSEVVQHLMGEPSVGIIILSGRGSLPDKVLGLELGADDYLSKPFDPRELIARTKSILRRIEKSPPLSPSSTTSAKKAYFEKWTFDSTTLTLEHDSGHSDILSVAESKLLMSLLESPKQILSRDQLMNKTSNSFDRSIDVRMSRIRKKIEPNLKNPTIIKTVYGAGYIFTATVEWK